MEGKETLRRKQVVTRQPKRYFFVAGLAWLRSWQAPTLVLHGGEGEAAFDAFDVDLHGYFSVVFRR